MTTMQNGLNPVQLHLLEMFNYCKTEAELKELQDVLANYYAQKAQEEADRLWDEGTLNEEAIDHMLHEHLRTPYNSK